MPSPAVQFFLSPGAEETWAQVTRPWLESGRGGLSRAYVVVPTRGLAHALKQQKKRDAALEQFQLLLEAVDLAPPERLARWLPWKLRVGNELANQFYLEGDYPSSLALYRALARSNADLQAQQAFQYQVGLCEERLGQTTEAIKTYQSIVEAPMPSATNTNGVPVQILRNMAALRISVLKTASQTSNRGRTPPTQP